ncbi:MAG TPA: hypothetical protein PL117_14570, partial [Accumulibacter sp.]|uniref:hypothetical protein n=1 Tax=Accumulibacter sp. TaxID=2053492 RepID=UPI002B7B7552
MGVLQGLCQVTDDLQALVNVELLAPLLVPRLAPLVAPLVAHFAQQEVEPDGLGVVIEDERRAEFGVL